MNALLLLKVSAIFRICYLLDFQYPTIKKLAAQLISVSYFFFVLSNNHVKGMLYAAIWICHYYESFPDGYELKAYPIVIFLSEY